jgi:hypothetical protein
MEELSAEKFHRVPLPTPKLSKILLLNRNFLFDIFDGQNIAHIAVLGHNWSPAFARDVLHAARSNDCYFDTSYKLLEHPRLQFVVLAVALGGFETLLTVDHKGMRHITVT